jgi:glycine/D-amino acid oxidase-like deaminating enzyme
VPDVSSPAKKDLIVVGAGIAGASVAYHAARAGAAVAVVDAGRPGGGVTTNSFAWVGVPGVRAGPAATLRRTATDEYHRLQAEIPDLAVTWSGSLTWGTEESRPETGPGRELVDGATVLALEPALRRPPEWAVWAPGDAAVDPVRVTRQLVDGARAHGASVHLDSPVTSIRRDAAGRVVGVETGAGPIGGATVVLAAGAPTASLAASIGVTVPVEPSPCPLHRFRAPAGLVRTLIQYQGYFDLRQVSPDRLIAAADSAERTLAAIRSTFRGAEGVELLSTRYGARPMPVDGEPIIGRVADVPGLYLAVMQAAVTLAPAVGRLVARELVDGTDEPVLAGCRLDRFQVTAAPR